MAKLVSRGMLAAYLLMLTWLVLFKFSLDIPAFLSRHTQSLNLVPFGEANRPGEMLDNALFFAPFGLLLGVNFKTMGFWRKLAIVVAFSLAVETVQFVFAIGASDITDVMMNTVGGVIGLALYSICGRFIPTRWLDVIVICAGILLLLTFLAMDVSHILHRANMRHGQPDFTAPQLVIPEARSAIRDPL